MCGTNIYIPLNLEEDRKKQGLSSIQGVFLASFGLKIPVLREIVYNELPWTALDCSELQWEAVFEGSNP